MNSINISLSSNTSVVDLMVDLDLTLVAEAPGDEADLCDVLRDTILARLEGKAKLAPGKYNIRMLCVVTSEEGDVQEEVKPDGT